MSPLTEAALHMRSAHHFANTARAHGDFTAWRFLKAEERYYRRLIASGQAQPRIDGGSSHQDLTATGDHRTPQGTRTRPVLPSPPSMPTRRERQQ